MCNCIKSVATSDVFCSVISGVLVFCISQIILEIIIKPKIAYRNLKNRISTACIYYADVITNPFLVEQEKTKEQFDWFQNSKYNEASNELRQLASEIGAYSLKKKEAKEMMMCIILLVLKLKEGGLVSLKHYLLLLEMYVLYLIYVRQKRIN